MSLINRLAAGREDRSGKNDRLVRRLTTGGELAIDFRLGGKGAEHSRPITAEIIDISRDRNTDLRTAALIKGIERVTSAKLVRGVYP